MATFRLTVNGSVHVVDAEPSTPLLWVLRDVLNLTGTKYGCGQGLCGACTVHVDGHAQPSCLLPVESVTDAEVLTIEGLSDDGSHPVQRAWIDLAVPQCGYCQAGQVMQAAAFLARNADPSDDDTRRAMNPNLCRCGTYGRILKAVRRAAESRRGDEG